MRRGEDLLVLAPMLGSVSESLPEPQVALSSLASAFGLTSIHPKE